MNLAIISTNKAQYSETFIHNHVRRLPANIHFLFDGYLPKKYSTDKGLTSHEIKNYNTKVTSLFKRWKDKEQETELINQLADYITQNHIDLILCEYGPSGVAMLQVSKKINVPMIVHFHGYDAYRDDILTSYGKYYPALFKHAKAVIAVSSHMCRQLEKLGCDPAKLHQLTYGIDTDIFYTRTNVEKQITFVACGRFVEKKGPQLTIKAFAEVLRKKSGVTLVMIGAGELLEECKKLAKDLGIKQAINFTGEADQTTIAEIYSRSSIFVQHSITTAINDSEGTPLAVLESGACGLPAVSTYHAGIPDVITEGENGFLVKEGDINSMTEKMLLLANDPELAKSMGRKAADLVNSKYKLDNYTNALWELILSCAQKS